MPDKCEHNWVYIGLEHLRRMGNGQTWDADPSTRNPAMFWYRIFYCSKCLTLAKVLWEDKYTNRPIERQREGVPDAES